MSKCMLLVVLIALMAVLMVGCGGGGSGGGPSPNAFPKAGVIWNAAGVADISLANKLVSSDGLTYLMLSRAETGGNGRIKIYRTTTNALVGSMIVGADQKILSVALRSLELGDGLQPYLLMQYNYGGWRMEMYTMSGRLITLDGASPCLAANFTATDIVTTANGVSISGHLALPH